MNKVTGPEGHNLGRVTPVSPAQGARRYMHGEERPFDPGATIVKLSDEVLKERRAFPAFEAGSKDNSETIPTIVHLTEEEVRRGGHLDWDEGKKLTE